MPSIVPIKFRTELVKQFHRSITNTINVPDLDSLTTVENDIFNYVATSGQTLFTGTDINSKTLEYDVGRINVFKNGTKLLSSQYIANSGNTVILLSPCTAGDKISIIPLEVYVYPNPSDFFHIFLGRTIAWNNEVGLTDGPSPVDCRKDESETMRNILAVKRVTPSDVAFLIPRIDWVTGTVYSAYTDDENISDYNFYVLTSSYRIYKCIFSPGSASIVEPSHTDPGPVQTTDGYQWQLLYEVPIADRLKFLNEDYIPVKFFSTSASFDHNGSITKINVITAGSGYTTAPTVLILGDGIGATATASVSSGAVTQIQINTQGEGYTFASIRLIGGGGSGATAEAVLTGADLPSRINQSVASYAKANGMGINVVEIINGGVNYTSATTITVVGDGEGAQLVPIRSSGVITGVKVINRGAGYTYANLIVSDTGGGTAAVLRPVIEPIGGHGSNIPQELFATTLGITTSIEDTLTDFFVNNDYRQIGLVKNIKTYNQETLFTEDTGTVCYKMIPSTGNAAVDNVITTQSGGEYVVVKKENNYIFLQPVVDAVRSSDTFTNVTQGYSFTVTNFAEPEISTRSGELIYYKNSLKTQRQDGQIEQLKLYLSF